MLGYLPPDAQDRLLDNISALSADGSRLATEAIPDMPEVDQEQARELMRKATENWRAHGFDLNFDELGYQGTATTSPTTWTRWAGARSASR